MNHMSCVVAGPGEARRGAAERVRTFARDQLAAARARRWDRLRVVCSQPYNKHCQYGLSFVHVFSPEQPRGGGGAVAAPGPIPGRMFGIETHSSDEEEFRPGELFARRALQPQPTSQPASQPTETQIRRASSNALKNISDSTTKLTKTPIAKTNDARQKDFSKQPDSGQKDRQKDSLMYTDDDDRPHEKIDRVVQKHKDQRYKEEKDRQEKSKNESESKKEKKESNKRKSEAMEANESVSSHKRKRDSIEDSKGENNNLNSSKRNSFRGECVESDGKDAARRRQAGPENGASAGGAGAVLRGVVFALSGYAHPRRGALRALALQLGARYRPDAAPDCTHLVCAFPNTPKLKSLREAKSPCVAVTGEWIEQCAARQRRLPERCFHPDPARRAPLPPDNPPPPPPAQRKPESDQDTDDEIEEVLREQAISHQDSRTDVDTEPGRDSDGDVSFVCDERVQGTVTLRSDSDTDTEPDTDTDTAHGLHEQHQALDETKLLPDALAGRTAVVRERLRARGHDPALLRRYLRAYGALVLQEEDVDSDTEVHYVVCEGRGGAGGGAAQCVSPRWVWRLHAARAPPPAPPAHDASASD